MRRALAAALGTILVAGTGAAPAHRVDSATPDPSDLVGTWRVDFRPTPESDPYYVEFTVVSASEDGLTGTFYDSAIETSAVNTDWGDLRFAIVTVDGSARYVTTGVLEGRTLSGTTYSPDRDLLAVWTAERQ